MPTDPAAAPPDGVVAAFGSSGTPVRLVGGQGRSWRVGSVVLKPAETEDLVGLLGAAPRRGQYLARALLFRLVADVVVHGTVDDERYSAAAALARVSGGD